MQKKPFPKMFRVVVFTPETERKRRKQKFLTAHTHSSFMINHHSIVKTGDFILLVRKVIVCFLLPEASGIVAVLYTYLFSE